MKKQQPLKLWSHYAMLSISLWLIAALLLGYTPVRANDALSSANGNFNAPTALQTTQLQPPTYLAAKEIDANKTIELSWRPSVGAAKYKIYRSKTQGVYSAGNLLYTLTPTPSARLLHYIDASLVDVKNEYYYYVVTAVDAQGGETGFSNEAAAIPHYKIGWIGTLYGAMPKAVDPRCTSFVQYFIRIDTPEVIDCRYVLGDPTSNLRIAGEIFIQNRTGADFNGPEPYVLSQLGISATGHDPDTETVDLTRWTNWINAQYGGYGIWEPGIHDRYFANYIPEAQGTYYYTYRFSVDGGRSWVYSDIERNIDDPKSVPGARLGFIEVLANPEDTTPPSIPDLTVTPHTATSIRLRWTVPDTETDIFRFLLYRSTDPTALGDPIQRIETLSPDGIYNYEDSDLVAGTTYHYQVVAVDRSFNRAESTIVSGTTIDSLVNVKIHVTIPPFTPGQVYINREYDPTTGSLGNENWKGLPVPCSFTTYQCDLQLSLQENTHFTFRFSRGSAQTVQTQLDGNSMAADPSFIVKAGMAPINRIIYNWDDPLVIDYTPKGSKILPVKTVAITWNQPMPVDTRFTVYDKGSAGTSAGSPVAGAFAYGVETNTVTFTADNYLKANWYFQVKVENQVDTNVPAIAQQIITSWNFSTDRWRYYSPLILRH